LRVTACTAEAGSVVEAAGHQQALGQEDGVTAHHTRVPSSDLLLAEDLGFVLAHEIQTVLLSRRGGA